MSALAIDYTYSYPYASQFDQGLLKLATFAPAEEEHPHFFEGRLARPRRVSEMLRGLMRIVEARFHVPPAMLGRVLALADPVVTCSDDRLRFEGFSGCCGVYARVDLHPQAVHGNWLGRGTTNVDFNSPMLAALAKIRECDEVSLAVGSDEVRLATSRETVVEKKVTLPLRWLKGFTEVQACQSRMSPVHEITGAEARRFLRSLPRMATNRRETWIVAAGRGLRLSQVASRDGVRVGGLERLRVLESLSTQAQTLRVYSDTTTGASGWELQFDDSRFSLVISPEVWRGFSGEGQALEALASKDWQQALPKVRANLKWEAKIAVDELACRVEYDKATVQQALLALGSRGLVGFDLGEGAFFHRELPFDLTEVEKQQPRLQNARKLIEAGKVRRAKSTKTEIQVLVSSGDVEHRVVLNADSARCTCPWYARHGQSRGPCKHILAARLLLEESASE